MFKIIITGKKEDTEKSIFIALLIEYLNFLKKKLI
jgi:hypothetical protein